MADPTAQGQTRLLENRSINVMQATKDEISLAYMDADPEGMDGKTLYKSRDRVAKEINEIHKGATDAGLDFCSQEDSTKLTVLEHRLKHLNSMIKGKIEAAHKQHFGSPGDEPRESANMIMDRENLEAQGMSHHFSSSGSADLCGFGSNGTPLVDLANALYRAKKGYGTDECLGRLRQGQVMAASQSTTIGSDGGLFIPITIGDKGELPFIVTTPLLDNADVDNIGTEVVEYPRWADDDHAATDLFGVTYAPVGENEEIPSPQKVKARSVKLTVKKQAGLFPTSTEVLESAIPSARKRLDDALTSSIRNRIEKLLWNGSGGAEPIGVINSGGVIEIAKEAGQASATLQVENLTKMWSRLMPGLHEGSMWVCNHGVWPQLAQLSMPVGTGGSAVGLIQSSNVGGRPVNTIFGAPLHISEHMPALGAAGDIMLVAPRLYYVAIRRGISIDVSEHVLFTTDQVAFRITVRFDGAPAMDTPITAENGPTMSWAVRIAERA